MEVAQLAQVLIGLTLLLGGKRLYYLFVGVLGFVIGFWAATTYSPIQSGPLILVVALACGVLGGLLAYFLQGAVIGVAGFAAGGVVLVNLARLAGLASGGWEWVIFVIGGALGAALVAWMFDWALIVLSALLGASWMVTALALPSDQQPLVLLLLVVVGVFAQRRQGERHDPPFLPDPPRSQPPPSAR